MWESSELSSILTNANWAVYSTPELTATESCTEPLLPPDNPHFSSVYTVLETEKWYQKPPHHWTKGNILDWISHHVEESQYDASSLDLASCSMDGPTLCQLSRDALLSMFGSLGERLFQNLLELKAQYGEGDLWMTCDFFNSLFEGYPEILNVNGGDSSYDLLITDERSGFCSYTQNGLKMLGDMTPSSDNGYESGRMSPDSLNSVTGAQGFRSPNSPSSLGSDSDQDLTEEPMTRYTEGELKRCKGRPKKQSPGSELFRAKKRKYAVRGTHLWEFIRDILIHPEQHSGLMKWEDRKEGVFKFLKSEAVAKLWGQKKRNSSMNYEKLSRAMRYYYKRQILERVDGRRLVYKFGKRSSGWREGEVGLSV